MLLPAILTLVFVGITLVECVVALVIMSDFDRRIRARIGHHSGGKSGKASVTINRSINRAGSKQ